MGGITSPPPTCSTKHDLCKEGILAIERLGEFVPFMCLKILFDQPIN